MKAIGWLKILGYVFALAALVMGYVNPKITIIVLGVISIVAKAAEEFVKLTPSGADDALVAQIVQALKDNGLLKNV